MCFLKSNPSRFRFILVEQSRKKTERNKKISEKNKRKRKDKKKRKEKKGRGKEGKLSLVVLIILAIL